MRSTKFSEADIIYVPRALVGGSCRNNSLLRLRAEVPKLQSGLSGKSPIDATSASWYPRQDSNL